MNPHNPITPEGRIEVDVDRLYRMKHREQGIMEQAELLLLRERVRRVCRNAFGYDAALGYDACELSVLNLVLNCIKEAELKGAQQMLGSIRASLEGYPHSGGDIRVMGEVERIKKEAVNAERKACVEIARSEKTNYFIADTIAHRIDARGKENEKLHNPTP